MFSAGEIKFDFMKENAFVSQLITYFTKTQQLVEDVKIVEDYNPEAVEASFFGRIKSGEHDITNLDTPVAAFGFDFTFEINSFDSDPRMLVHGWNSNSVDAVQKNQGSVEYGSELSTRPTKVKLETLRRLVQSNAQMLRLIIVCERIIGLISTSSRVEFSCKIVTLVVRQRDGGQQGRGEEDEEEEEELPTEQQMSCNGVKIVFAKLDLTKMMLGMIKEAAGGYLRGVSLVIEDQSDLIRNIAVILALPDRGEVQIRKRTRSFS